MNIFILGTLIHLGVKLNFYGADSLGMQLARVGGLPLKVYGTFFVF
jgi:hypothetical protein